MSGTNAPLFLNWRWCVPMPSDHDWELWMSDAEHVHGWRVVASGCKQAVAAAEQLLSGEAERGLRRDG